MVGRNQKVGRVKRRVEKENGGEGRRRMEEEDEDRRRLEKVAEGKFEKEGEGIKKEQEMGRKMGESMRGKGWPALGRKKKQ